MFDISSINFANGVYNQNGKVNGMEVMIMHSNDMADKVINDFEQILQYELSPLAALDQAFKQNKVTEEDFSDFDLKRINRKVNAIYKNKMNRDGRF